MSVVYEQNDQVVLVNGLSHFLTRVPINDAVFSVTLTDANGLPISGATSLSMTQNVGVDGQYYVYVPGTIANREPDQGDLQIQASNYTLRWERVYTTRKRR